MKMISISSLSKVFIQKNDMTNNLLNTSTYAKYGQVVNKLPRLTSVSCDWRKMLSFSKSSHPKRKCAKSKEVHRALQRPEGIGIALVDKCQVWLQILSQEIERRRRHRLWREQKEEEEEGGR